MPELGSLWYSVGLKDLTDADIKKINEKLKNLGSDLLINPKLAKSVTEILPKGIKLELEPQLKAVSNEALAKAVEGKVMKVEIAPLLTNLRKALKDATKDNPPEVEVGVQSAKLRTIIQNVLNKQGFMLNISTVNDNYSKVVQQKLNGTRYTVRIHADAKEITRSVQASLMQVQSRAFGLQISRDILYRSIDDALGHKRFIINVAVQHDQARKAVQDALLRAQVIGKDQALAYQRLQTGELKAAQAELARLKAAHMGAADAAKAHASASINLGGALGSNIKIAGELSSAMASLYSVHAAKEFLSQVIEIGGELEHQKIAMDTIFGDKGKTSELFGQIKGLARQSPFGVMELTKSVKALSAYGVQYNEIYDTAKRLADISAATSVDINRLILAFGKTKSRGFLDGLEAKQFAYANIPIYEMVRRKLEELEGQAVTTAQVMERMKKREIGFDIVKDVLWDMTDEGGKFYNMQEALAGSVKTSWKLVRDNIELMFGEIAESSVGGALKSIAEVLQTMTRNWRTMGAAVASVVTVLGLSKIATYGLNRAMEQSVGASTRQILADKKKEAARLRAIRLTSSLTAEEERLIRTSNRLTAEDIKQAYAKEGIAKETVRMLYLTKQLSSEEVKRLATMGMIDAQTAKSIVGTNRLAGAYARLKVSLGGIRQSIGMAMGAMFNWTTAIFAAIGALVMLWQRNSEFNRQAKETSEDIYSKAAEGANNLKKALEDIKPSAGLSEHELTQGIAQMQQAIKDYSPTPIEDINNALVDQKGHVRELTEQYDTLQKRVATLADAFDGVANKKVSDALESAIKNTKKNFLSDDIEKQYQDLGSAMEDARSNILAFEKANKTSLHGIIEEAANLSPAYRKAIANMTHDEQKFQELAMNSGKYWNEMSADIQASMKEALNGDFWREGLQSIERLSVWNTAGRWNRASDAAKEAARDLVEGFKTELRNQGADMSQYTEDQLRTIFTSYINGRQLSEDMKRQMKIDVGAELKISLIEEDPIGDAIKDQLKRLAGDENEIKSLSKELGMENAGEILKGALLTIQYDGYDALSPAEKQVVDKLMGDAKTKAMDELSLTNQQMANYLVAHPLTQLINIVYQERNKPSEFQKELWDNKPELKKHLLKPKEMGWYNSWTSGSSGYYETKNKIKQDLESRYNEILAAKNASEEWRKAKQEEFDAMKALAADMGYDDIEVGAKKSNKHPKESQKDKFAESLKQRLVVLKKAYSEYKKELATMSKDAALERIKEAGIFDELFTGKYAIGDFGDYKKVLEKLLADAEASLEGLSEKDKNFKGRHDLVISLRTLLNLEIPRDETKEAFEKAKSEIDNLVKGYTDKWNFHKQLFELTGDRETSIKLAFGEDVAWQTQSQMLESILNTQLAERGLDVPLTISDEEAKEKLKGTPLYDLLWKPTKEAKLKEGIDLQINVAKAVADAASIADKIKVQMGLREADETMLRSSKKEDGTEYSETEIAAYLKKYDDRIEELKSSMLELLPIWEQIFGDHQYQSYGQIQAASDIAKQIIDNAKINKDANGKPVSFTSVYTDAEGNEQQIMGKISQLEKLRKAIQDLYKEGLKKNPFATLWENLKKVFNGDWKDKNITEKLALIGESAAESAQLVGNLAGQLAEMFEAAGNDSAAQAMTDVQDVMNTVSNIGKGFAEGGLVGGIAAAAGEAIGWVTKAFQASARHKEALRAIMNETLAQQREYNLLLMQQNLEYKKAATILGEDTYGKAKNAVKVMKDAYADLDKELGGTQSQKNTESKRNLISRIFGVKDPNAELRQAYAGLADIEIKTGHKKTGLFGWGKGKDIYSSILDVYPDLIDANGKFNSSLAETIINTRVMSDEDKAALQNMIDLAEQAEAAYEELNSYMTDIFGELGSSMTDALVSAFANGTDAAEAFYGSVSDMLENLAKQMIYSVTLAPLIEEASKKMMNIMQDDSLSDEEKFTAYTNVLDDLIDGAVKEQDNANKLLKDFQDRAKDKGFDIFKPDEDSKSGLSAGIQSVTEDTADLLASYLNAIRADVAMQTGSYWTRLLDDSLPQMNVIAQSQLDTQRQIAENTLRTAEAAELIRDSNAELVKYSDKLERSWRRIAERNWGYS